MILRIKFVQNKEKVQERVGHDVKKGTEYAGHDVKKGCGICRT